jgi:hypothetical protein
VFPGIIQTADPKSFKSFAENLRREDTRLLPTVAGMSELEEMRAIGASR